MEHHVRRTHWKTHDMQCQTGSRHSVLLSLSNAAFCLSPLVAPSKLVERLYNIEGPTVTNMINTVRPSTLN